MDFIRRHLSAVLSTLVILCSFCFGYGVLTEKVSGLDKRLGRIEEVLTGKTYADVSRTKAEVQNHLPLADDSLAAGSHFPANP